MYIGCWFINKWKLKKENNWLIKQKWEAYLVTSAAESNEEIIIEETSH